MKLPDKVYDVLKWVCALYLPIVTFILSIADAYGMDAQALVATIGAIGVLAGSILKISDVAYNKENTDEN